MSAKNKCRVDMSKAKPAKIWFVDPKTQTLFWDKIDIDPTNMYYHTLVFECGPTQIVARMNDDGTVESVKYKPYGIDTEGFRWFEDERKAKSFWEGLGMAKKKVQREWKDNRTLLHKLYCEFKDTACGSDNCFSKNEYYTNRCIPALCFVRWLVKSGQAYFFDLKVGTEIQYDEDEEE